jgi:hypothetical protein
VLAENLMGWAESFALYFSILQLIRLTWNDWAY